MATTPDQQPSIAPIVGPDDPRVFTDSGIEIEHEYGPDAVGPGLEERLGTAGEYPFTRGIHPDMYAGAGGRCASTPGRHRHRTNERFAT